MPQTFFISCTNLFVFFQCHLCLIHSLFCYFLVLSLSLGVVLCLSCAPVVGNPLKASKLSQMSENQKKKRKNCCECLINDLSGFEVQLLKIKQSPFILCLCHLFHRFLWGGQRSSGFKLSGWNLTTVSTFTEVLHLKGRFEVLVLVAAIIGPENSDSGQRGWKLGGAEESRALL